MDKRAQAYKTGFLVKLAELGITPDEFFGRAKQAFDSPLDAVTSVGGELGREAVRGGADAARLSAKLLGAVAVGAPLAVGGASGAADALLNAPSTEDIEVLRKSELLGLYNRLTQEIKARQARRVS